MAAIAIRDFKYCPPTADYLYKVPQANYLSALRQRDFRIPEDLDVPARPKVAIERIPVVRDASDELDAGARTVLDRLQKLHDEDEDLVPTEYAYWKAYVTVRDLATNYRGEFPRASVAVGTDQAVYFYWTERQIGFTMEFMIPSTPSEKATLFVHIRDTNYSRLIADPPVEIVRTLLYGLNHLVHGRSVWDQKSSER